MDQLNLQQTLTDRQMEISRLVAYGLSNAEIACQLGITPNTCKRHLEQVFIKVGVQSRAELISVMFAWNFVDPAAVRARLAPQLHRLREIYRQS